MFIGDIFAELPKDDNIAEQQQFYMLYLKYIEEYVYYELLNIYRTKLELTNEKINKILAELYDSIVILLNHIDKNQNNYLIKQA